MEQDYKMEQDYGLVSNYFELCADHEIYHFDPSKEKEDAVCPVYQPEKPRRAALLGLETLGILKHFRPNVHVYLFGSKESHHNIWFEHTNLGLLTLSELNKLYNRCEVGLCISSSNPSRVPFEMMASGLPVVELYRDNNLYDMPEGAVLLADQTPESMAEAIMTVLDDKNKQRKMSQSALAYMAERTLEYGDQQFLTAVNQMLNDDYRTLVPLKPIYTSPPIRSQIEVEMLAAVQPIHRQGVLERSCEWIKSVLK